MIAAHTSCSVSSQLDMEEGSHPSVPETEELLHCNTHKPAFFAKLMKQKLPQEGQLEISYRCTPGC